MRLVADIGGTNSRLALADSGQLRLGSTRSFRNAEHATFESVVDAYFADIGDSVPDEIALAVAGPVDGGNARLTNRGWKISAADLAARVGSQRCGIINDLVALGYSVPVLGADDLDTIVKGRPEPSAPRQSLVVGIGTGFNVSPVVQHGGTVVCLRSESGHVGLPAGVAQVLEARQTGLAEHFPTVEHCFSGRGFALLCQLVTGLCDLGPEELMDIYDRGSTAGVTEAVDLYGELIGWLHRELMLAYLPSSGIYYAGSVSRSVLSRAGRARFQEVVARPYNIPTHQETPIHAINADTAALHGCTRLPLHDTQ